MPAGQWQVSTCSFVVLVALGDVVRPRGGSFNGTEDDSCARRLPLASGKVDDRMARTWPDLTLAARVITIRRHATGRLRTAVE